VGLGARSTPKTSIERAETSKTLPDARIEGARCDSPTKWRNNPIAPVAIDKKSISIAPKSPNVSLYYANTLIAVVNQKHLQLT
jgi:hypothetical protein